MNTQPRKFRRAGKIELNDQKLSKRHKQAARRRKQERRQMRRNQANAGFNHMSPRKTLAQDISSQAITAAIIAALMLLWFLTRKR